MEEQYILLMVAVQIYKLSKFANNEADESGGAIYNTNGHLRLFKGTFNPNNKANRLLPSDRGHDIYSIESRSFLVASVNFDSITERLLGYPHACNSTLCAVFDASSFQDAGVSCSDKGMMGVQCDLCVEGKFRAINDMHSHNCIRCRQGTYAANQGQSQCTPCEAGKFQQLMGQTNCEGVLQERMVAMACSVLPFSRGIMALLVSITTEAKMLQDVVQQVSVRKAICVQAQHTRRLYAPQAHTRTMLVRIIV